MSKSKKIVLTVIFAVVFVLATIIGYLYYSYTRILVTPPKESIATPLVPTPTPDPLRAQNMLLLGYAGGKHEGTTLTDTIILAHIVPREKKVVLISVPRDIWVPIEVKQGVFEQYKINHAYAIGLDDKRYPDKPEKYRGVSGGGNLVKDTLSKVTGLSIDGYIALDFEGFTSIVDMLGGIEINVATPLDDEFYPIEGKEDDTCEKSVEDIEAIEATLSGEKLEQEFKCRYEHLRFEQGLQLMNGETALKYVRSRHAKIGGGDFARAVRQQAFLEAMKRKLLTFGSLPKMIPIVNRISSSTRTDLDLDKINDFATQISEVSDFKMFSISLNSDNILREDISRDGQFILLPKEGDGFDSLHRYIQEELNSILRNNEIQ